MAGRRRDIFQRAGDQIRGRLFGRHRIQQLQYFLNLGNSFTHGLVGGGVERAGHGGVAAIQNEVKRLPILVSQLRFHNNPGTK